ncbi:VOC family protein [Actinomycetospora sp. C-140]
MGHHLVAIPILPVREMADAVAFWSRVPHLTVDEYAGGGYAFVRHDGAEVVHLGLVSDLDVAGNAAGCYLHVDDADRRRAELADAGLPVSEVREEPWGLREFRFTDPSGNVVRLGSPG